MGRVVSCQGWRFLGDRGIADGAACSFLVSHWLILTDGSTYSVVRYMSPVLASWSEVFSCKTDSLINQVFCH